MLKKLKFKNLQKILKEVIFKFPVAMSAILIVFILIGYQISADFISKDLDDTLLKIIISTIAVFFLSTATVLIGNIKLPFGKRKKLNGGGVFLQLRTIIFGFLFYYFFSGDIKNFFFVEQIIYIFLIFIGIISFLFFSVFIGKKYSQNSYYNYFIKITAIFGMSFILGTVLTILGFIGLWAIFTLFDLRGILREGDLFGYFANFSLIIFTPIFFLSKLSKKIDIDNNEGLNLNNFLKLLLKYIAIPSIYIYFVILYIYTIKVLLNFTQWPEGEVSWMVIGFSLFGYLIYIFSYGLEQTNKSVKTFRNYFPYVVFPQIGMLFYAIYLRINQYDITINRYFVVVFGICLTIISLYFIISKYKKIMMIPVILFGFIISISIGPWGVFNLPESRQLNILEKALIEANIKQEGKIILPQKKSDIEPKLSGKIYDLIGYLINNHGNESLEKVFSELIKEIKENDKKELENTLSYKSGNLIEKRSYEGINSRTLKNKLIEKLKVQYYDKYREEMRKKLYFGMKYEEGFFPLNIKNYDYITKLYSSKHNLVNEGINNQIIGRIDIEKKEFILSKGQEILETINIEKILNTIVTYNGEYGESNTKEDMTFEISSNKYEIKLFIRHISLMNPEYKIKKEEKNIYNSIGYMTSGYVLVRKK